MSGEMPFELLHSELVEFMFAREQETSSVEKGNTGQDELFLETVIITFHLKATRMGLEYRLLLDILLQARQNVSEI